MTRFGREHGELTTDLFGNHGVLLYPLIVPQRRSLMEEWKWQQARIKVVKTVETTAIDTGCIDQEDHALRRPPRG